MRGGKEGAREHKIFLEIMAGKGPWLCLTGQSHVQKPFDESQTVLWPFEKFEQMFSINSI